MDRLKDPKFWAMILAPVCAALIMYLEGSLDLAHAVASALSGLMAGLLGVAQPQPQLGKPPMAAPAMNAPLAPVAPIEPMPTKLAGPKPPTVV